MVSNYIATDANIPLQLVRRLRTGDEKTTQFTLRRAWYEQGVVRFSGRCEDTGKSRSYSVRSVLRVTDLRTSETSDNAQVFIQRLLQT